VNREEAANIVANIEVIKAFAEGKTIQFNQGAKWADTENVGFTMPNVWYRIKPEPKKVWIRISDHDKGSYVQEASNKVYSSDVVYGPFELKD